MRKDTYMSDTPAPTTVVESTPEVTPEATPAVAEPTPTEGDTPAAKETVEATAAVADETAEPESLTSILESYEADDSPHREAFQQWRQEEQGKGWAEARESFTTQLTEQQERSDTSSRLYEGATQAYKTTMGRLDKALQGGQVDREALNEVFQDPNFARATEAIGKEAQKGARDQGVAEGRSIGANSAMEGMVAIGAKVLGRQSLAKEYIPKIAAAKTQEEAVAMIEGFVKSVKDIGYQQGLTDGKSGTQHADDIATRKGEKPAQSVGSTAGGKTEREEKLDPNTPTSRLRELRGL